MGVKLELQRHQGAAERPHTNLPLLTTPLLRMIWSENELPCEAATCSGVFPFSSWQHRFALFTVSAWFVVVRVKNKNA